MPIEIRELVIKVTIQEDPQKREADPQEKISEFKEEIINEVYEILLSKLDNISDR